MPTDFVMHELFGHFHGLAPAVAEKRGECPTTSLKLTSTDVACEPGQPDTVDEHGTDGYSNRNAAPSTIEGAVGASAGFAHDVKSKETT
jgi:hypothetical protein